MLALSGCPVSHGKLVGRYCSFNSCFFWHGTLECVLRQPYQARDVPLFQLRLPYLLRPKTMAKINRANPISLFLKFPRPECVNTLV